MNLPVPFINLELIQKDFKSEIEETFLRVLSSNHYIMGSETYLFESEFASFTKSKHCLAVGNGTDALEIALRVLGVTTEDCVLIVGNAGGYAMTALNNINANYIFVEISLENLCMSAEDLTEDVLKKIKGVVVTHLYGNIANIEAIVNKAKSYGAFVIEDCAQAHGAELNDKHVGNFGDIGTFSFYPTKNLGALGDAGAIVTSDDALAEKISLVRQYGWSEKYISKNIVARNSRIDEIQAAILRVKLKYLKAQNDQRAKIANIYMNELRYLPIDFQCQESQKSVYHLFVIRTHLRNQLHEFLKERDIATMIHYPLPDYQQQNCINNKSLKSKVFPKTNLACESILSLPIYPNQPESDLSKIIENIKIFTKNNL